jgi:rod shape-determining protein MreC
MQQLILFLTRYRNNLLLLALLLLAFIRHSYKNPVSEHWINQVGSGFSATISNTTSSWKNYWTLEDINEELARENATLRASLWASSAPSFALSNNYNYIPVKVIDFSYKKRNNYIVLGGGKSTGILPGMGVISASGWVGTVSESTTHYAYVVPFTHTKGEIGARLTDKGLGQLSWTGDPKTAILKDIEREFKPAQGDSVYSYTRVEIAPPVLTGIVLRATQSEEDLSWDAEVELTTDFRNLDWVYVCQFTGAQEIDSLKTLME